MKTHRESHVKAEHNYNTQMHTLFKGNRMPLKLSLCLFLLSLIHLFFSFLYAWHYLHWFYSSLLIPVLFFILFLSAPLLQQPDISWTPGLRRKWLFVWSSKQRTMTVFLPSPWLTHTLISHSVSLFNMCLPVPLFTLWLISVLGSFRSAAGTDGFSVWLLPWLSTLAAG